MTLTDHPTVRAVRGRVSLPKATPWDATTLRDLALACGADDAGVVSLTRPELADQRDDLVAAFPATKSLLSFVVKMNREPIRSTARSVANLEFHHTTDESNEVANRIVTELEKRGVRALNPPCGFPMEMAKFPGKIWVVSHKPVAVAAGLGRMGIHRNVIHPKFGNFILLGTILIDAVVADESQPIDYNPCLTCKLCVAACPVGAIHPDGQFDFSACVTHNYREFMNGFTDWASTVADSRDGTDYRRRVGESESASMWQSLSFGANYKAAYCLAVCPAGEDVIPPFLDDRGRFVRETLKPLQQKKETLYVVPGSDAEAYAAETFPHKSRKAVSGIRVTSIKGFLAGMAFVFQRGQSDGLNATYHFTFTGTERAMATVVIRDRTVAVTEGHAGTPDLAVTADADSWVRFLRKEANIVWLMVRRKVRVKGPIRLLKAFGRCFPS